LSVALLGLSYHETPVEVLEKFCARGEKLKELDTSVRELGSISEHVALMTCNRTEIYAASGDADGTHEGLLSVMSRLSGLPADEFRQRTYFKTREEAVKHLFAVAAGVDSLALGETEILGQVKDAYQRAHAEGCTGRVLNTLFQKSLSVGKKARTETQIGRHKVSIASIAVDLAGKMFLDLSLKTVLVIGSGEMARQSLASLRSKGVRRVLIANRSSEKARDLATQYGGQAVPYEGLDEHAGGADILIASTAAPEAIVTAERAQRWSRKSDDSPLFILDLGIPRNVAAEASETDGVYVYNLDDLKAIADGNLAERRKAVEDCEELIRKASESFMGRLKGLSRKAQDSFA